MSRDRVSWGPARRRFGVAQMIVEKVALAAQQSILFPAPLRPILLRALGARVGRRVRIAQKVFIGHPTNLTLGDDVFINVGSFIDCAAPVMLYHRVRLGYGVMILTGTHHVQNSVYRREEGDHARYPVVVHRGCWLHARSIVNPGVTMSEGCVLYGGAVLTRDTHPNAAYAGVPAALVRYLSTEDDHV